MSDLDYHLATEVHTLTAEGMNLRSVGCALVHHAYLTNMNRALGILQIPGIAFLWGEAYEQAEEHVRNSEGQENLTKEERQLKVSEAFAEKVAEKRKNPMEFFYASKNFSHLVDIAGLGLQTPVRSILNSLLIQVYTCFEVLCGDLWEAAVNEHPMILAELKGRNKSEKDQLTTLPIKWFTKFGYKIESQMGSILRTEGKCSFDSLSNIRTSYKRAFSIDYDKINLLLDNKLLDMVSAFRNVLVHNNGLVDDDFLVKSKIFSECLDMQDGIIELKKGHAVKLNGKASVEMLKFMGAASTALVIAVDDWLKSEH